MKGHYTIKLSILKDHDDPPIGGFEERGLQMYIPDANMNPEAVKTNAEMLTQMVCASARDDGEPWAKGFDPALKEVKLSP